MFIAAYDDRAEAPDYLVNFIQNTTSFCDLHLITSDRKLLSSCNLDPKSLRFKLHLSSPASLPFFNHVTSLFDDLFVNYSTNDYNFERACFHRWFALNAATIFLKPNDYLCLLDTDFLIGMSPVNVLSHCELKSGINNLQFVAEWDIHDDSFIGPEFTIMTKSFLHGFCQYLLTAYFSPSMKDLLLAQYYDRIGNGLPGGICDMRALAAYLRLSSYKGAFNMMELDTPWIIGCFNKFLSSGVGQADNWKILLQPDKQTLQIANESTQLIGTHFQGSAKMLIPLVRGAIDTETVLTKHVCAEYSEFLSKRAKSFRFFLYNAYKRMLRASKKLKSALTFRH